MAIKNSLDLLLYEQHQTSWPVGSSAFIGLFLSKSFTAVVAHDALPWLRRISSHAPAIDTDIYDDVACIASAYVRRTPANLLVLDNVVARAGYGPTLYATLLQIARDGDYLGVAAPETPCNVLERAKPLWARFVVSYPGQIGSAPLRHYQHPEGWLNQSYSGIGTDLVALEVLRRQTERYLVHVGAVAARDPRQILRDMAFELAGRSGEAHRALAAKKA